VRGFHLLLAELIPLNPEEPALGQFINYKIALSQKQPERTMYLAVPIATYETFFKLELIQLVIKTQGIRLIVYNPSKQEIEQWIS